MAVVSGTVPPVGTMERLRYALRTLMEASSIRSGTQKAKTLEFGLLHGASAAGMEVAGPLMLLAFSDRSILDYGAMRADDPGDADREPSPTEVLLGHRVALLEKFLLRSAAGSATTDEAAELKTHLGLDG
jgi:hypothetical protein